MTRAALYLRQSLDVREGIERQRTRCEALAQARGWTVVDEYADNDTSASKVRGPGTAWGRMLSDATAGRFDVVISADLDRLLRSTRDLVTLIDTGAKVVTIDGEIDLSTADGEFRATMLAGIARFEVRRKTERRVRANDQRTAQGKPQAGRRRFGFEADHITPRESEAFWVRWAYAEVNAGGTLFGIMRRLNEENVLTAGGSPWTVQALKKMLKAHRNAGRLVARGIVQETSQITPLVSDETFDQAVAILTAPGRGVTAGRRPELNWLSGIMRCGVCGAPMRTKSLTTKDGKRAFYQCEKKVNGTAPGERHRAILTSKAEAEIPWLVFLLAMQADAGTYDERPDTAQLGAVQLALSEATAERHSLMELWTVPGADKAFLTSQLASVGARIEQLEAKLVEVRASSVQLTVRDFIEAGATTDLAQGVGWAELREAYDRFEERFNALLWDRKRELVQASGSFTVHGGKKDRITAEPY